MDFSKKYYIINFNPSLLIIRCTPSYLLCSSSFVCSWLSSWHTSPTKHTTSLSWMASRSGTSSFCPRSHSRVPSRSCSLFGSRASLGVFSWPVASFHRSETTAKLRWSYWVKLFKFIFTSKSHAMNFYKNSHPKLPHSLPLPSTHSYPAI